MQLLKKNNLNNFFLLATLCAIIFLIPFEGIGGNGLGIPQNNLVLMFVILVIGGGLYSLGKNKDIFLPLGYKFSFLGVIVAFIPLLFHFSLFLEKNSVYLLLFFLMLLCFFFALFQFQKLRESPEVALKVIIIITAVQVAYGLYQNLGAIAYNIDTNSMRYDPAPLGMFHHKNVYASFVSTGALVATYLLTITNSLKQNLLKVGCYIVLFSVSFLLIFSNSRIGFIGFTFGLFLLAVTQYKDRKKDVLLSIVVVLLGSMIALFIINFGVGESVPKDYTKGGSRVAMYTLSWEIFKDSPIIGHGFGSFERELLDKIAELEPKGALPSNIGAGNLTHPHNEILLWAVEGGIISIVGILGLAIFLISLIFKNTKNAVLCIALITPLILHTQVEFPFYVSLLHAVVLVTIIAYFSIINKAYGRAGLNRNFNSKAFTVVSVLFSIGLLLNVFSLYKANQILSSGGRDISRFNDILITVGWSHDYENLLYTSILSKGVQEDKEQLVNVYINWAQETIKFTPRWEYYNNLRIAYVYTGDNEKAKEMEEQIKMYYPRKKLSY